MTLRHLARFLGRDERELLDLLDKNKTRPPFEKIVLGRDVDWRSVVAVETHQLDLPGVTLGIHPRRSYLNTADSQLGCNLRTVSAQTLCDFQR